MNNITKPISVARMEFIKAMSDLINNCNLPMYVVEPILAAAHRDAVALEKRQYEADLDSYLEAIGVKEELEEREG